MTVEGDPLLLRDPLMRLDRHGRVFAVDELERPLPPALREQRCACLDLLLPHLHSTWQRTVATELELQAGRPPPPGTSLLARTRAAQDALGLGPAEIGGLLLDGWGLPVAIVDAVRAIDRLLVTPPGALADAGSTGQGEADGPRLAVAHLCARLGEQLAGGATLASAGSLAGLARRRPGAACQPDT